MLYTNWRDEKTDLIGHSATYKERYFLLKDSIDYVRHEYEPFHQECDEAEINTVHCNADENDGGVILDEENESDDEYDIGIDLGVPKSKTDSLHDNCLLDEDEYYKKMQSLNSKQYMFVMDLLHHIKTSDEPLGWRFLSGGAGVGKTHATNMFYQFILHVLSKTAGVDPSRMCVLKIAPTGKAAFLIRGNTIHSALRVPVSKDLSRV